jgi:methylthioribose-1-phosphate isomerase
VSPISSYDRAARHGLAFGRESRHVPNRRSRSIAAVFERTIWWADRDTVAVIDQTQLPHDAVVAHWRTVAEAAHGIASMQVRGAPLIGVAAAHGMALAMLADAGDLDTPARTLAATRPTAVNLTWALRRVTDELAPLPAGERADVARTFAARMADDDVAACCSIGEHGARLLREIYERVDRPVQVLTHCNAGRLACIEWGTATAPVYVAVGHGLPLHVWVSETRPRNQGAALTAWELADAGVPHTLVVDNAAGHLLRTGQVDAVIVGADRVAANGDVANKIGTSLKAFAAREFGVPFWVAAPGSTFDAACATGDAITIEERDPGEVLVVNGAPIAPAGTTARNWGFDVTPARLVDAYLTEQGVLGRDDLAGLLS